VAVRPHPDAVPDPADVWRPPWALDVDALRTTRERQAAEVPVLAGPPVPVAHVADVDVAGVPCRVYDPAPSDTGKRPAVVYAHGGGWIVGSVDTVDGVCRRLAVGAGALVVSVEYRMAPEHHFPAAVDDMDAVVAAVQGGAVAGADPARLAVAGDSAGGHLATVAARRARDAGRPVAAQALVYPVVDAVGIVDGDATAGLELGFARGEMAFYWDTFLPTAGLDRRDPDVSPLHADLAGMPRTLLVLAGHDVLTPEGEAYGEALVDAGVEVVVTAWPRMPHGFLRRLAVYPDAVAATDLLAVALGRALSS
jgi:acetyl esterase